MRKPVSVLVEDNVTGDTKYSEQVDAVVYITLNRDISSAGIYGKANTYGVASLVATMIGLVDDLSEEYPDLPELVQTIKTERIERITK